MIHMLCCKLGTCGQNSRSVDAQRAKIQGFNLFSRQFMSGVVCARRNEGCTSQSIHHGLLLCSTPTVVVTRDHALVIICFFVSAREHLSWA